MKTLFINPPNRPFSDPALLIEPIDVLGLATYAGQQGHAVRVRDMDREQLAPARFAEVLAAERPDCVVIPFDYHIPLYTPQALAGINEMIGIAASLRLPVGLGGRPATYAAAAILSQPSPRTVIVRGEMEQALAELLARGDWSWSALAATPGITFMGPQGLAVTPARRRPFDLDSLPIPDRSLVPLADYIDVRSMLSSRGCVERCSFCPVRSFWGAWRGRRAALVADEIERLIAEHGAKKIILLDDHAAADRRRLHTICAELRARRLQPALGCLATPQSLDHETLGVMREAGFRWVHVGAEFGSDRVLAGLNKRSSVAAIRSAVRGAKAAGIRVRTSWIFDAPHASAAELDATIALILETQPEEIRAHFLAFRPGAPLAHGAASAAPQYLHAAGPQTANPALPAALLEEKMRVLCERLGSLGYRTVRTPAEWAETAASRPPARFISFCPARYGIGWSD